MDPRQSRTLVGLMGLVVLWIVLYWTWQPRSQREPVVILPEVTPQQAEDPATVLPRPEPEPVSPQPEPLKPEAAAPPEHQGEQTPFGQAPFRWVTIEPGDTFARIAERELGSAELWTGVARANPLKDPNRLRVGEKVKVPIDPANPQGRPGGPGPTPPQPDGSEVKVIEYTVKPGDTLSGIAQEFYGSVRYIDFIYQFNRDRLRSKDDLRLGQVLRLPPRPSDEDGRP
ncbi:MAG: LysM peptidoglycan-binding domain-containing protein [Leptolyngbya sp. PLA3]|nr:MAG: LysM peptidoglycan-binding domain-containing protein [Cyanobacteria bacterium CYA]MCE7968100.1 LysM peptidoglycan-binding domain-containing protein [Leptolyngbya sp. PL-A3]